MAKERRITILLLLIGALAFSCATPDAQGANWKRIAVVQVGLLPYCDGSRMVSLTVKGDGLANENVYFVSADAVLTDNVLLMALTALKRGLYSVIDYQESASCASAKYTPFFALQSDPVPFKGGVGGSLTVDLADAIMALQIVSGTALLNPGVAATISDVNSDGKIGLPEVIYILQKVAGVR